MKKKDIYFFQKKENIPKVIVCYETACNRMPAGNSNLTNLIWWRRRRILCATLEKNPRQQPQVWLAAGQYIRQDENWPVPIISLVQQNVGYDFFYM